MVFKFLNVVTITNIDPYVPTHTAFCRPHLYLFIYCLSGILRAAACILAVMRELVRSTASGGHHVSKKGLHTKTPSDGLDIFWGSLAIRFLIYDSRALCICTAHVSFDILD